MEWETVIGIETHVQLATVSKIFSGASTNFGAKPNSNACEVDIALPGVLPVLNKEAVEKAIRFAFATNAKINQKSIFARKNYFYPDLPKGYPCGFDSNELPIGLQLIGNYFDEARLLSAAHQYQNNTDWHSRQPKNKN